MNILSTTELLSGFRETSVYLSGAETNVVFLDESLPTHADIVDSEVCDTLFDALRDTIIAAINDALAAKKTKRESIYAEAESKTVSDFVAGYI